MSFSAEVEQEMVRSYESGTGCYTIGKRHGCRQGAVHIILKKHGVKTRPQNYWSRLPARSKEIVALYDSGMTIEAIAKQMSASSCPIRNILLRAGVTMRPAAQKRKWPFREDYFSVIDTEEKAYWLGFLAGDGGIVGMKSGDEKGYSTCIALAEQDIDHVRWFASCVEYAGPLHRRPPPSVVNGYLSQPSFAVQLQSRRMAADLLQQGVTMRKSLTLEPWIAPNLLLQTAWWRGMVDADGSLGIYEPGGDAAYEHTHLQVILVGTYAVCSGLQSFVAEQLPDRPAASPRTIVQAGKIFHVQWHGKMVARDVARLLYENATIALPRKLRLAQQMMTDDRFAQRDSTWSHLTAEYLTTLSSELKNWHSVADRLGCDYRVLIRVRRRLGLSVRKSKPPPPRHDWTGTTLKHAEDAYRRSGSWPLAAESLGVGYHQLMNFVRSRRTSKEQEISS